MSLKGKEFTAADLPRNTKLNEEQKTAWAATQTERYAIVATDKDSGETIIAEELDQRALNKLSAKARRAAGMMMRFDQDVRAEIIAAFETDGSLKYPFDMVK